MRHDPPSIHQRQCHQRDMLTVAVLTGLFLLLVPTWVGMFAPDRSDAAPVSESEAPGVKGARKLAADPRATAILLTLTESVPALLAAATLPAALGMALAMRAGVLDLSVWASMGVGGLAAASALRSGRGPAAALTAALAAGLMIGLANGVLALATRRWRFAASAGTMLVAIAVVLGTPLFVEGKDLVVSESAFAPWTDWLHGAMNLSAGQAEEVSDPTALLRHLRMFIASLAWASVLVVLVVHDMTKGRKARHPDQPVGSAVRAAALAASGLLAGCSGFCWLTEVGHTPVPTRVVDNLFLPAAVLLAGAALLRGRGRAMLCGILLPSALLVAQVWRQTVWPVCVWGVDVQLGLLIALTAVAQGGLVLAQRASEQVRSWGIVGSSLGAAALAVTAFGPFLAGPGPRADLLAIAGLGLGVIGAAGIVIGFTRDRSKVVDAEPESR